MKKICVCGHFGLGKNLLNGQTVKTKIITNELEKYYGKENIVRIDTHGGKRTVVKILIKLFGALASGREVVIMPAYNGIRVIVPFLYYINKIFHRKIFYVVIGGWLPTFLKDKPSLKKQLNSFNGIYVETKTMKTALEYENFNNVFVLPNCKKLEILCGENIKYKIECKRICTFSRVMKEKGIEEAIDAVVKANIEYGEEIFSLDIYGQIDEKQKDWFENIMQLAPEYIQYKGIVPFDQSSNILKEYFILLFPTYYEGEGFAGTLIDAMAAGLPVVATDWKYNAEIVSENKIGCLVQPHDVDGLRDAILELNTNEMKYCMYKKNCILNVRKYLPENAIKVLIEGIGE